MLSPLKKPYSGEHLNLRNITPILISFFVRFLSGLLPILVIYAMDVMYDKNNTGVYLFLVGISSIIANFTQGIMPVSYADAFLKNKEKVKLTVFDYKKSIINVFVTVTFVSIVACFLDVEYLTGNIIEFLMLSLAYMNFTFLGKYYLNKFSVNHFVFYNVACPNIIVLVSMSIMVLFNVRFELYYIFTSLSIISFLPIIKLNLFCYTTVDKNEINVHFRLNFKERILRALLAIIEQLDVLILTFVGLHQLVVFAYLKRIVGVGSIASSIITKTFESKIVGGSLNVNLMATVKYCICGMQTIFVICIFFLAEDIFSNENAYLFISAGVISVFQILISGEVVSILLDEKRTIITILFLSAIITTSLVLYFNSNMTTLNFSILFIVVNLFKILILKKV
ncbi:hypothetical protein [Vibrio sp. ZF 223]|uniref:hypothetical protein n=1 Tax=Vibrio sp. ZF 223 TaxID=2056191 RepID=UPI000D37C404|nr:hypothetical protein [Vibrio sp. ZF 223]PTQ02298.1 hypothetical protein CWO13_16195 [Vibrio sp. ZF 223]